MTAAAIEVWTFALSATPPTPQELQALSPEEALRHAALRSADAARRFARTRLALRRLLGSQLDLDPRQVAIGTLAHGKPFVAAADAPFFNVSHASDRVVIAIGGAAPLGIDIESDAALADRRALWATICSAAERDWLERHPALAEAAFARLWARKEALLKAVGTGLATPPSGLDLAPQIEQDAGSVALGEGGAHGRPDASWRDLAISPTHHCAIACMSPAPQALGAIKLRELEPDGLGPGR